MTRGKAEIEFRAREGAQPRAAPMLGRVRARVRSARDYLRPLSSQAMTLDTRSLLVEIKRASIHIAQRQAQRSDEARDRPANSQRSPRGSSDRKIAARAEVGREDLEFIARATKRRWAVGADRRPPPTLNARARARRAFRGSELRDRANRRTVERSGLLSPWELPRTAALAGTYVVVIRGSAAAPFEMFKWLRKKARRARARIRNYFPVIP